MSSTNNPNQQQGNLNNCNPKGIPADVNLDLAPPYCDPDAGCERDANRASTMKV